MGKGKIYFILFIEGLVSISMQILIMRQLTPFVGGSIIAVSFVISFFLLALAFGYKSGGNIKHQHLKSMSNNFMVSAFILGVSFSYWFIELFFKYTDFIPHPLLQVSVYLLIFLVPPIYLLGQTIPLMTNFIAKSSPSEIAGHALSINTVGSVVGSIFTSIIMLYFFGVANTIFINIILLLILFIMANKDILTKSILKTFQAAFILLMTFNVNINYERTKFIAANQYANYEVIDDSNFINPVNKTLVSNRSLSSLNYNNIRGFDYIEYVKEYLFHYLKIKDSNVLVLGAGGFTFSMGIDDNHFTYVDIDSSIKSLAESYFLNNNIKGDFIASDARSFLRRSEDKFDIIYVDIYESGISIPWHFATQEFMIELKESVALNGYIGFNIIAKVDYSDRFSKRMHNTITSVFDYCHIIPIFESMSDGGMMNKAYICKNTPNDNYIYSDDEDRHSYDDMIKRN